MSIHNPPEVIVVCTCLSGTGTVLCQDDCPVLASRFSLSDLSVRQKCANEKGLNAKNPHIPPNRSCPS